MLGIGVPFDADALSGWQGIQLVLGSVMYPIIYAFFRRVCGAKSL